MEILSSVEGTTGKDDKKHKISWGGGTETQATEIA